MMAKTVGNWMAPLLDMADIARHAKNGKEIVRALLPAKWVSPLILNGGGTPAHECTAVEAAMSLRQTCNALKAAVVTDEGWVAYAELRGSDLFRQLEEQSLALEYARPEQLTDAERTAFWLNVYNVLSIHGVIALGVEKSVMEFPSFFRMVAYRIAHEVFTPDDVENGVLRCNAPHPATRTRMFKTGDPRLAFCPSKVDPRIHAALVCVSKSCPPVAFYDAENVDAQLSMAAHNYIECNVQVDAENKTVLLPIAFRYFTGDFGGWPGVKDFILRHAGESLRSQVAEALADDFRCVFQRYDWSLNSGLV